eukprot:scaffold39395_cov63-Cyclotella_meneghiniana.AAC.1
MSSVYEIHDGESGRISQRLCIRNGAAIHARDGGGKGGGYFFCKIDEDEQKSVVAGCGWAQDGFGGLVKDQKLRQVFSRLFSLTQWSFY